MTGPGNPNDQDGAWAQGPGTGPGPLPPPQQGTPGSIPPSWAQLPPGSGPRDGSATSRPHASFALPEASAWTGLLAAVPWFFWSLVLVVWVAGAIGFGWGWIVVVLWILSGAVIFLAPTEELMARYLFRLRKPTLVEQQRLGSVWQQLLQRAQVREGQFSLWIQESDEVNATPTPGHTVAVTRWALYTLPPSHLEATLAHELSHHLGGRAWLSMISFWYSIPARCGLIAARAVARLLRRVPALGCIIGGFLVMAYVGLVIAVFALGHGYIWPFLFLTPFIAPPFLAWLNRWHVKQADRKAALMGYSETLVQVLYGWQMQHQQTLGRETSRRAQVMSSSPSLVERVHTLEQTGGQPRNWP
jgi:Zn-dependent protease with chaperone function